MRKRGEAIPALCRAPAFLQYGEACSLGKQIEHLYAAFPREQVLVIAFDDLVRDAASVYRNTLELLGLSFDGRERFDAVNEAKTSKFVWLGDWTARLKPAVMRAALGINRVTGINVYGLLKRIERLNQLKEVKSAISAHMALELQHYFESDVVLLSSQLGRNLSAWDQQSSDLE